MTTKKPTTKKTAKKVKSTLHYLCVGPRDGWCGKEHKTLKSAQNCVKGPEKFGITTDRIIMTLDTSAKPTVEPNPDTGGARLSLELVPLDGAQLELPL